MPTTPPYQYEIYTAEDLFNIRYHNNQSFKLMNDIDLQGFEIPADHPAGTWERTFQIGSFPPIRDYNSNLDLFSVNLDGQGYAIKNLSCIASTYDNLGLFKNLGENSSIRNLFLADVNISGNNNCGGLSGSIESNNKTIKLSRILVTGTINGFDNVGGILGNSPMQEVTIFSSAFLGDVTGNFNVGGLLGSGVINIYHCFVRGNITGLDMIAGFCGAYYGSNINRIIYSYFVGNATSDNNLSPIVGHSTDLDINIIDVYYNKDTINEDDFTHKHPLVKGLITSEIKNTEIFPTGYFGNKPLSYNFYFPYYAEILVNEGIDINDINDGYPMLCADGGIWWLPLNLSLPEFLEVDDIFNDIISKQEIINYLEPGADTIGPYEVSLLLDNPYLIYHISDVDGSFIELSAYIKDNLDWHPEIHNGFFYMNDSSKTSSYDDLDDEYYFYATPYEQSITGIQADNKYPLDLISEQFSPITVIADGQVFHRVFFDSIYNTEQVKTTNRKHFADYTNIIIDDIDVAEVNNNLIVFKDKIIEKEISYKINNTFFIDDDNNIIFSNDCNNATVYVESNKYSPFYMAEEVNLNPTKNDLDSGFIYLSNTQQLPQKIDIISTDTNGEHIDLLLKITDQYNNPVYPLKNNVFIDVIGGDIKIQDFKTDQYGNIKAHIIPTDEKINIKAIYKDFHNSLYITNDKEINYKKTYSFDDIIFLNIDIEKDLNIIKNGEYIDIIAYALDFEYTKIPNLDMQIFLDDSLIHDDNTGPEGQIEFTERVITDNPSVSLKVVVTHNGLTKEFVKELIVN